MHAPFWNEPVVRDYIKQASQHGLTRTQHPLPGAPAQAPAAGPSSAVAAGTQQLDQVSGQANAAAGQRREYSRVLSAPAKAGEPAAQQQPAGGYDPDAAPRIRTVKMRGVQPRTSQDGPLRR